MDRRSLIFGAAALLLGSKGVSAFGGDRCHQCGCCGGCDRICRVVCEKKTVKEPCYEIKEVDICLPGKSCKVPCDCPDGCCKGHHGDFHWQPGCATPRTVRKLIKTEKTKTVCEYKWVVEYLCPKCQGGLPKGESPSDAPPPTPSVPKQAEVGPPAIPVSTDYYQR